MVVPVPPGFLRQADRLSFTLRSGAPMRVSVQIRISAGGARWQRSIYASPSPTAHSVAVRELTPVGTPPGTPLDLTKVDVVAEVKPAVDTEKWTLPFDRRTLIHGEVETACAHCLRSQRRRLLLLSPKREESLPRCAVMVSAHSCLADAVEIRRSVDVDRCFWHWNDGD